MFNDPKSKYLFAFEKAVANLISEGKGWEVVSRFFTLANARLSPGFSLAEGMWTNAHMHFGSLAPEEGAKRFYDDVVLKYHRVALTQARQAA